jgi:hypothetical protein
MLHLTQKVMFLIALRWNSKIRGGMMIRKSFQDKMLIDDSRMYCAVELRLYTIIRNRNECIRTVIVGRKLTCQRSKIKGITNNRKLRSKI